LIVSLLDRRVPKRSGRVVLGSDKALKYNGNPRYLFEYLADQDDWDPYWLSERADILTKVNARYPGRGLHARSWRALRMGLTAQWLGFSHSRYDLGLLAYLVRRRFIYLNHGVPLKTMGFDKAYRDPATANAARSMAAVTCCSQLEASLWARAYGLPIERMWITGVPRNDRLFIRDEAVLAALGLRPNQRLLLFAPTYRETGLLSQYLPVPELDVGALVAALERHDAVLLVRPHYYERAAAQAMVDEIESPFIRVADEAAIPEVNELLPHIDILITDYSSIFFDFLLLDRPIIFSCFDQEDYARTRGFSIDYDENTPGEKVRTGPEFLAEVETLLSGEDRYRHARAAIRRRFHQFDDGRSAERVAARMQLADPQPER
jgi:CDP-glycerol glycerophosphotransferase (TagB/SpsB family)